MSNPIVDLADVLGLDPIVAETIPFKEFLLGLKENADRADNEAGVLLRAIANKGMVDIESADSDRRPYLEMLQAMGLPSFNAFEDVCGSQRIAARLLAHYMAGAGNGYQLRQILILIGGPGGGKSLIADCMKQSLEGELVYSVKGCPNRESPINLLKLLNPSQRKALTKALDMEKEMPQLLSVAIEPCEHCVKLVKGDHSEPKDKPSLADVEVTALRLSSRLGGISTWSPAASDCSLIDSLRQGARGIVDMPDAFLTKDNEPGKPHPLLALLDACEYRRVPGSAGSCGVTVGFSPLSANLIISTNRGAFDSFLELLGKDREAFLRRARIINVPYNTVQVEETRAYRNFLAQLKAMPHFDPLALKMIATVAILSRLQDVPGLDLITKMRLYNGDRDVPTPKPPTGTSSPWPGGAASANKDGKALSTGDLWKAVEQAAAEGKAEEGMTGLDMSHMLGTVSSISDVALQHPKHQCVSALSALRMMRMRIKSALNTPSLSDEKKSTFKRSVEHLQLASDDNTVGIIEREYRRLLREQLLRVFAPDYETRAQEDFETYRLHAYAQGQGWKTVKDPRRGNRDAEVNTAFLDQIDAFRVSGFQSSEDKVKFRGSLDARINQVLLERVQESGDEDTGKITINWETIPELAKAIRGRLDDEIAKKVDRILTANVADLKDEEKRMRTESLKRFKELGYCEACLEQALNYCKEFKLWNSQS